MKRVNGIRLFVTNYSPTMNPESIVTSIIVQVNLTNHLELTILSKTLYKDGIVIEVQNENQAAAVMNLMGLSFGTKHLWITNYPTKKLKQYSLLLSQIFEENFTDNYTMNLSRFYSKFNRKRGFVFNDDNDKDRSTFDLNNDSCMEYLFLRLGMEAKENNTIIKHLILSNNSLTHIAYLDRLLFFLPGLIDIDLRNNVLLAIPDLRKFSNITLLIDSSKNDEKDDSGEWDFKNSGW